jgi:predicted CXXCH cytochrome family protein
MSKEKDNVRHVFKIAGPLVAVAVFLVLVFLWAVGGKGIHQFEGKCNLCHVGLKDPSILTKEIDFLCLSCHPDSAKRSHPSNIIPTQKMPNQYPLFRGKLVCTSCHFPHHHLGDAKLSTAGGAAGSPHLGVPGPYMLRAKSMGKVFCFSCHKGGFSNTAVDSHAVTLTRAHTPSTALSFEQKQMMDDHSRECLSCHDGTISSGTHTQIRSLSWQHNKDIGMSHPISVDYEQVYLKSPRDYHPPERLDKRITLINGKIGCETCHNHYSKEKKHLVMKNIRSRLCLSCHNL